MKFFNFTKIKFPSPFVNDYKALDIKQYHEKNNPFDIMHIFGNKTKGLPCMLDFDGFGFFTT